MDILVFYSIKERLEHLFSMKLNLQNIRFDIPINYEFKQLGISFFYSKERPRIVRAATEVHDSSLIYAVEDKNFETEKNKQSHSILKIKTI